MGWSVSSVPGASAILGQSHGRAAEIMSEAAGCRRLIPHLVHAQEGPESLPPRVARLGVGRLPQVALDKSSGA